MNDWGPVPKAEAPTPGPPRVQWRRVWLYVAVVFAATFLAGCAGGFLIGFSRASGEVPPWTYRAGDVFMIVAVVAVFAWIGRVQNVLTAGHAALVWALANVAGFVLNVLLLGQPIGVFVGSAVASGVLAAIGTGIGVLSRRRATGSAGRR